MPAKTITVSAEGKVTVEPDIAKISFSVISDGMNPEQLADTNNKKMKAAIAFIKSQGIDDKDIKTIQYTLNPRYEYDPKTRRSYFSGYTLIQTVSIKVRDLNKVPRILGSLPGLGINQIGSISFEVDGPEKYLNEARNQAFDKAKEKAREMALKNGVNLVRVINFSEYQTGEPLPYSQPLEEREMAKIAVPSIQPGTQEVTIRVNLTYEIN